LLSHPPDPQSLSLLLSTPPLSDLPALLPSLTPPVSTALHTNALSLARIASPTTNPSYLHRTIPNLPVLYADLQRSVADSKAAVTKARLDASVTLTSLLQDHVTALSHLVRSLEAKHGVVARSLELRAAQVALDAQKAETDAISAKESVRKAVYSPDMVKALGNYEKHLRNAKMRLEQNVRDLKLELEGYGVGIEGEEGKERTMREIARVYREMSKQMDDAKADLERLGRS
jgi:GTP cyclohydrolase III